jgi:drug/metabolite transporter (DMT)-like permease
VETHKPILGILLRLGATINLAIMFACAKLASAHGVSLVEIVFFRQFTAIPLILAFAGFSRGGFGQLRTTRLSAHMRRMMLGVSAMALNFTAAIALPLTQSTAIGYTIPLFGTILAVFLLGERVGVARWSAIAIGFAGVLIITNPFSAGVGNGLGIAAAIGGAALTAGVSVAIADLGRTEKPLITVFWFSLLSMLPLGILMFGAAQTHNNIGWLLLFGIGISGAAAQIFLTASLRLAPVSVVLPVDYIGLLWAAIIGWAVFSDIPNMQTWVGAGIIIVSALTIIWREHRKNIARISV